MQNMGTGRTDHDHLSAHIVLYLQSQICIVLMQGAEASGTPNKDAGVVGRATSDFSLDDLLGLGPDPDPAEATESGTSFSDPFQVVLVSLNTAVCQAAFRCSPFGYMLIAKDAYGNL